MNVRSEYLEGKIFAQWLRRQGLRFSHLPLGFYSTQTQKLRSSGVTKGVPDYVIVIPPKYTDSESRIGGYVIFVELKRAQGGKASKEQKEWVEALTAAGCPSKVCRGADEAIRFVEGFL